MSLIHRMPRGLRTPVVIGLAFVVFLVSIGVGLRGDPFAFLFPFGRGPGLDYSAGPNGFVPLDPGYVADVLGEDFVEPVADEGAGPAAAAGPRSSSFEPPRRLTDVHPLTNDDREDARAVPGVPFTARTNTSSATRESGEPASCSGLGESTVWYRYSPSRDLELIANTFGSSYATALGVFEQREDGALEIVGCDTDLAGDAIYQFSGTRSATYLFQIIGPTRGGDLVFNLEPLGETRLASANADGEPASGYSRLPSISADGRIVVFSSTASDLAVGTDPMPCTAHARSLGGIFTSTTAPEEPCQQAIVLDRRTGEFTIATVNDRGEPGNGGTYGFPIVSGNGRYVVFTSTADNLVPDDTNQIGDLFVHDLVTRRTERISMAYDGRDTQLEIDPLGYGLPVYGGSAFHGVISHDGRYIAYASGSSRVVEGDTNNSYDVFVHDRWTHETSRVSVSSTGRQGNGDSLTPSLSADGRFVSFGSYATTLTWDRYDPNADTHQVFVHDRLTGRTTLESITQEGVAGAGSSGSWPSSPMSGDGRYLVFGSGASNLVDDDTNGIWDVFLRDRIEETTRRISVSSSGEEGTQPAVELGSAYYLARDSILGDTNTEDLVWTGGFSRDGRYVVFDSQANGLVPEDANDLVDVFIHDVHTATTIRVSVNLGGDLLQGDASYGVMSADGHVIAFTSLAQLGEDPVDDLLTEPQLFVHERVGAYR